jgi:hypothetical protein
MVSQKTKVKSAKFPALRIRGAAAVAAAILAAVSSGIALRCKLRAGSQPGDLMWKRGDDAGSVSWPGRQGCRRIRQAGRLLLQIGDSAPNAPVRNGTRSSFTKVRQTGRIDSAIIAKLLPRNGERISAPARMVVT